MLTIGILAAWFGLSTFFMIIFTFWDCWMNVGDSPRLERASNSINMFLSQGIAAGIIYALH